MKLENELNVKKRKEIIIPPILNMKDCDENKQNENNRKQ